MRAQSKPNPLFSFGHRIAKRAGIGPVTDRNRAMGHELPPSRSASRSDLPRKGGGKDVVLRRYRHWLHTFSTSGRPRMPVGRKISTMMRIEKAATSLYSIEK